MVSAMGSIQITRGCDVTMWSSPGWQILNNMCVWYKPQQMSHLHDFKRFHSENENCRDIWQNNCNIIFSLCSAHIVIMFLGENESQKSYWQL